MSKTLLVLGARSDIAQACAHEFAANGFDLILAARNSADLANAITDHEIRHNVKVYTAEFDAAKPASHAAFYAELPIKPDVVLYAIGTLGDQKISEKDWTEAEKVITSNYTGGVSILSIVANDFETGNAGTIIGISSVAGERGRQSNYIYGSAKAGFTAFMAGLRHRLATTKVKVLTVKPGFVETKMTDGMDLPGMLTAKPAQIAKAIFKAYRSGKSTLYYLPIWRQIMYVVRSVPEFIFVKTKL
ncbi:MAG TPA: SDR family oxidoreductase [Pyrinomonadaceae bacterium]|nr:SDR family oxidoreductase [Acidobacteriota bacterium]HQZ97269.1 SDR family oxidoreductase [Pyrinomonadaceae bacterium]